MKAAAFVQRRKTLRDSLKSLIQVKGTIDRRDGRTLAEFSADPIWDLRPEGLSVEDFIALTGRLS